MFITAVIDLSAGRPTGAEARRYCLGGRRAPLLARARRAARAVGPDFRSRRDGRPGADDARGRGGMTLGDVQLDAASRRVDPRETHESDAASSDDVLPVRDRASKAQPFLQSPNK